MNRVKSQDQRAMSHGGSWDRVLLMILVCLLPLLIVFVAFGLGRSIPGWVFIAALLACLLMHLFLMRPKSTSGRAVEQSAEEGESNAVGERALRFARAIPTELFEAERWEESDGVLRVGGRLRSGSTVVLEAARQAAAGVLERDAEVLIHQDELGRPTLVVLPEETQRILEQAQPRQRPMVNLGLFLATLATTTWAGAAHTGVNLIQSPGAWMEGVPYALGLMLILGFHEMGHYLVARRHGVRVSLPYFIPVPFALGTFGAFISVPALLKNRRQLFDIGVAGPLAGLIVTIPALLIGLQWSTLSPQDLDAAGHHIHQGLSLNSSLLLALLAKASLGEAISQGHVVQLHPLAFAGWLGLLLTALNLLPVGQLDGGHIAHALLGRIRAAQVGRFALFLIVGLGFLVWPGLLFWALLVYFLAGRPGVPLRDDVTPLDAQRRGVGWASFALLVFILMPLPHAFSQLIGLHCPYV
jgi:membrane-associated protease RseP (regulator of RpoE activity)